MTSRKIFTLSERTCLRDLVVKWKLDKPSSLTVDNQSIRKRSWRCLTEEFNTIETKYKRSELQLRKCWDNLKTRQKDLAKIKRERLRKTDGPGADKDPNASTGSLVDEALYEEPDVNNVFDSDPLEGNERGLGSGETDSPLRAETDPNPGERNVQPPRREPSYQDHGAGVKRMTRKCFTLSERTCLKDLIVKWKLDKPCSWIERRNSWRCLTKEFNTRETSYKRSELQLRKCWDNLKNREKDLAIKIKRERLRRTDGPGADTDRDASTGSLVDEALYEEPVVKPEINVVFDSDPLEDEDVAKLKDEEIEMPTPPTTMLYDALCRRDSSRSGSNFGEVPIQGRKNVRLKAIEDEFAQRKEAFLKKEKREEELHRVIKQEKEWLAKTAEAKYYKAKAEAEVAEMNRKIAEFELKQKLNGTNFM